MHFRGFAKCTVGYLHVVRPVNRALEDGGGEEENKKRSSIMLMVKIMTNNNNRYHYSNSSCVVGHLLVKTTVHTL